MNILISASGYPTPNVPYAAFVQNIAEEMLRQGNKVTILAPQSLTKSIVRHIPLMPRVDVQKVGDSEITVLRPWVITFGDGIFARLTNVCNRLAVCISTKKLSRPDLVYAHFWSSADNILNYVVRNQIPLYVATGEDIIDFDRSISQDRIKLLNAYTSGVICVSTKNMKESIEHGLTQRSKCKVFPNAINPDKFHLIDKEFARKQLECSETDFVVAYCGRFNYRKGSTRTSDAIKLLNDKQIKAIFIGGLADNYKIQPDCPGIIFKGRLAHEKIALYLNAADVFVLPTLAEGCPNSVVEAMACGLPIISSDCEFNHDILNESNSLMIDPLDINEIADAINIMKNNEALRYKLRQGAIKTAEELTIKNRVSRILDFITNAK